MFDLPDKWEPAVNAVFLAITAYVAWRGLRYRDEEGKTDTVHLLFGCIAAVFFFLVLFQDVLGLVRF